MAVDSVNSKSELLQKFWDLAEPNDETRVSAAKELIAGLINSQKEQDEGLCEDLTYTLQRLIRGLSSQRKAARLGFYIVLCEIFKQFEEVSLSNVKGLINKFLDVKGSKTEISNLIIGQALAYGAVIRSGRINKLSSEELSDVVKDLLNLKNHKAFTKTLIISLIMELLKQISEKKFKKVLWQTIQDELTGGWDSVSADRFLLLLSTTESFPAVVDKEFLKNYWDTKNILSASNYERLTNILIDSAADLPIIHPVCFHIVRRASQCSGFENFWMEVIDQPLFSSRKDKLAFLGFEIIKKIVPTIQDPKKFSCIFTQNFLQLLITSASNNHVFLHNAAKSMCQFFVTYVQNCSSSELQIQVIHGFCKEPGSIMFDRQSKTKTLGPIALSLQSEALDEYIELLKSKFLGNDNQQDVVRQFCIKQLSLLIHHAIIHTNEDKKVDILKFLFLHSFFNVSQPIEDIDECKEIASPFADNIREAVATNFQHVMENLMKLGQGWKPQILGHLNLLHQLILFADRLINSPNVTISSFDKSLIQEIWSQSLSEINKLKKKMESNDDYVQEYKSFQVLYMYLMLQLFLAPSKTIQIIEEVQECSKRALKRQKTRQSKKLNGEPEWVEVIVDVLLSMLSQGNKLTRTVVDNVFCLICPRLTEQALQQILDVISVSSDETPLVEDNSSEEDESGVEDEDEDAEDMEINDVETEELRSKVFEALGPANDAGSEEEETYLNDDDMFKLDDALADAFRSMKKPKNRKHSKEDESLMNFRLKCIDLLNILIRVDPRLKLLIKIILPVISSLKFAIQHNKFERPLIDKTTLCLNHLCNLRKFSDDTVDEEDLVELANTLVKMASSTNNLQVNHVLSNCCVFVLLCNRKLEAVASKKKRTKVKSQVWYVPLISSALSDFFRKKNCHLQSNLFQSLLTRNRSIGWEFRRTVFENVLDPEVRLFQRTQGLNILCKVIKCGERPIDVSADEAKKVALIEEDEWKETVSSLEEKLLTDLKNFSEPELKPKHVTELLRLLQTLVETDSNLFNMSSLKMKNEFVEVLLRLPVNKLGKEGRKMINKCVLVISGKPILEFKHNKRKFGINGNMTTKKKAKFVNETEKQEEEDDD